MSELTQFPCGQCGAQLKVDGSTQTPACAYCGTQTLVPEAIWRRFHPLPAPDARAVAPPPRGGSSNGLVVGLVLGAMAVVAAVVVAIVLAVSSGSGSSGSSTAGTPSAPLDPIASAGDACRGREHACSSDEKGGARLRPRREDGRGRHVQRSRRLPRVAGREEPHLRHDPRRSDGSVRDARHGPRREEHEALIRAVFAELDEVRPPGLAYQAMKLEDGVTFVHLAVASTPDAPA